MADAVHARLTTADARRFGLVVGSAFLAFGALSWWRGHELAPLVLWTMAGALLLGGLLMPDRLGPVHAAWMRLALALSRITTPIVMSLVFYLVFLPIGALMRRFHHHPLARPAAGGSYWVPRAVIRDRRHRMERQF